MDLEEFLKATNAEKANICKRIAAGSLRIRGLENGTYKSN